MNKQHTIYNTLIFIALLLAGYPSASVLAQQTERHYLSGRDAAHTIKWDFYCTAGRNSGAWTTIDVPSNWELQGFGRYNYGHDWKNKEIPLGKEHGLYKYKFKVPKSWKGKSVNIVFDGSMTDTNVKINGKKAGGTHQGGFNRFKYDISRLLKYGSDNLLEVDVAKHSANASVNRAERQADFWIFGGIYRPVFLEVKPAKHMTRVAINAQADGHVEVLAQLNSSKSDMQLSVTLQDMQGHPVGMTVTGGKFVDKHKIVLEGDFEDIQTWNPEAPALYDMTISLMSGAKVLHREVRRVGFRTVELRSHDGIYVNDTKVVFKGVDRHSFWPETGRTLSDANHKQDIGLIKDMNMNAVRMSHYCPDERFLDLCDSLGLFVLDELTGWQQGYDTIIGPKRIKELIYKDENHPSVVIWDHGNEGGWDFANEKWFHHYDIQQRPVIYPWLHRNGVDAHHYGSYQFGIDRFAFGNDIFMPTEFLHGLYDGGLGAGLYDYWRQYRSNPRAAGGFLWVFSDEAVLRTDKPGKVYDSDGKNAPDGIVGPHREKEGSYYTIKELWSPVQVLPVVISPKWNGKLRLKNDFLYTNLNTCHLRWQAIVTGMPGNNETKVVDSGELQGPDALPGETRQVTLPLHEHFKDAEVFQLTATDGNGHELYTWRWPVQTPEVVVNRILASSQRPEKDITTTVSEGKLMAKIHEMTYVFDLTDGKLTEVQNLHGSVPFGGGPVAEGVEADVQKVAWQYDDQQNLVITARSKKFPEYFRWIVRRDGLLAFEAAPNRKRLNGVDLLGVGFHYPEKKVKSMEWLGNGPYRVWKNRIHGTTFGHWQKDYNNTVTGESFNKLIYPEFKGYHARVNWIRFQTEDDPFTILIETPNIFVQVFTPAKPKAAAGGTYPPFPDADISFLYEIPPIGTKFRQANTLGPTGQQGIDRHHLGDDNDPVRLYFDFRAEK